MAPEQMEHHDADARSDQFAFCVALYEALYGQRPFAGRRMSELKPEVLAGRVRPPPADSPVPAYVRKAVLKGLSVRPDDRFTSMEALLDTLSRDPRQVWRRALWSAAALGCLGLGLGAVVASRVRAPPVCGGAASRLAGVWDSGRKDAVRKAFLATGKPFAQASATEVARALDEYAAAWTAGHTDACEATRVRREQSEGLMELRMLCLDRRRQELDALGDLFSTADAQVVEKAVQASRALTPVKSCGDLASLTAGSHLPEDPVARPKVEAVRQQLARVNALEQASRYREGLALAQEALATARTLSFRPLEAEVQLSVGALRHLSDDMKGAEASLTEAVLAATAGRHAEAQARAWTRLVAVEAELNPALAHAYGRHAAAALEGFGHDEVLEARLLSNLGTVFYRQGDYPKAREHYRRALALNEKTFSPDDPSLAVS
ncbi:MAG TPA: tetratricopeptide repeat protein, partial [Myxococcaceae bacterium]|nr:tetratricopeptide repeat protein [Myxococcaceae bacterium]